MPSNLEYTAAQIEAAAFSPLTARPVSPHAVHLCDTLAEKLLHRAKRRPNAAQRRAAGALIADLLERDPDDQGGWLFRSTASGSFSRGRVGYRPFMRIFDAMTDTQMIEVVTGNRVWLQSDLTAGKRVPHHQKATRFRSTTWLRGWFAAEGVARETWADHFARDADVQAKATKSVALKAAKSKNAGWKTKGRPMSSDIQDPVYQALTDRMDRINAYLSKQVFAPFAPIILRRIFANGDHPSFAWDQGGRVYALGRETYQTAKKTERAKITINGAAATELDLRVSHLTIMVGLGHVPLSVLEDDPYQIDGLPRDVVKQWVTMTLSHGKRHKRWPPEVAEEYLSEHGQKLPEVFPLRQTGDLILSKLPIVGKDGRTAPITWAELQFLESEILLEVMEKLAFDHDVPALPVHDSLIVPREAVGLASSLLKEVFMQRVGVIPKIA
jgi:hypothetical protein